MEKQKTIPFVSILTQPETLPTLRHPNASVTGLKGSWQTMRPVFPVREMFFNWTITMRPMLTQVTPLAGAVTTAWDTEYYRGIKPMAEGHPKLRIGSDDVTASITSPLVCAISDTPNLSCMFAQMHTFRSLVGR